MLPESLLHAPEPGEIILVLTTGLMLIAAAAMFGLRWRFDTRMRHHWQAMRGRATLGLPRAVAPVVPEEVAELREIVTGLVKSGRWRTLGAVLEMLAARPMDAADGRRLHDAAVDAALAPLGRARGLTALDAALAPYARAAEDGTPALVALEARALAAAIARAEAQAGEAGRAMALTWAGRIETLARSRPLDAAVLPLLAEALYVAAATASDLTGICTAFRRWQAADPGNARTYVTHAARLAALGPPAEEELGRHFCEAVAASRFLGGPGPVLRARLAAAERGGRSLASLPGHTPRSLLAALDEVAEGPGGQAIVNAVGAQALKDGDESLARAVVAQHLTLWIPSLWPDREGFLALYWRAAGRYAGLGAPGAEGDLRRAAS
ncbi:hypothetical protein [Histidinibacterium lentulum]|uniref:Uncharacterized protein n=1 Tax=Histidinibacterium lentulum TaxID=2480588 RepID=A0A3N2R9Q7_9RHOB|nr:hypothetical protein [Histidinibacterium lentulum]ROU04076.1 hypothetical protein EAT49_01360 [Histidinibacterium lentulum]